MSIIKKNKNNTKKRNPKRDWRDGLTPQQIARLESDEPLFPEKLAKANEIISQTIFMDDNPSPPSGQQP